MNLNEYQDRAVRQGLFDRVNVAGRPIAFCALALCGEAGELANVVKKAVREEGFDDCFYILNRERPGERNVSAEVLEEAGDALWYLAVLVEKCGFTLEEVARFNIEKVDKRYPELARPEPDERSLVAKALRDLAPRIRENLSRTEIEALIDERERWEDSSVLDRKPDSTGTGVMGEGI